MESQTYFFLGKCLSQSTKNKTKPRSQNRHIFNQNKDKNLQFLKKIKKKNFGHTIQHMGLYPQQGIHPLPCVLKARSLNHWTSREFSKILIFRSIFPYKSLNFKYTFLKDILKDKSQISVLILFLSWAFIWGVNKFVNSVEKVKILLYISPTYKQLNLND